MMSTDEILTLVNHISITWAGVAVVIFIVLLRVTAPYGRHTKPGWGLLISNAAGWAVMELPSLIVYAGFWIYFSGWQHPVSFLLGVAWMGHYTWRSLIFPLLIRKKERKIPLSIVLMALVFNLMNAGLNGIWSGLYFQPEMQPEVNDFLLIAGALLFICGVAINQYHDRILLRLRKSGGYAVPYGGLFRFVSCPNFLGEIIEWGGFALMACSWPALSFFAWTIANLVPRALAHHRWYNSHFTDYPTDRKALIPAVL
ncbi:MAG: DUF1295 domain-containing protein [Bacteroidales bacterium]